MPSVKLSFQPSFLERTFAKKIKVMDISTLTSLINTFRAETKQDSITPDSLGQRVICHQAIPEDVCRPFQCHFEAGG